MLKNHAIKDASGGVMGLVAIEKWVQGNQKKGKIGKVRRGARARLSIGLLEGICNRLCLNYSPLEELVERFSIDSESVDDTSIEEMDLVSGTVKNVIENESVGKFGSDRIKEVNNDEGKEEFIDDKSTLKLVDKVDDCADEVGNCADESSIADTNSTGPHVDELLLEKEDVIPINLEPSSELDLCFVCREDVEEIVRWQKDENVFRYLYDRTDFQSYKPCFEIRNVYPNRRKRRVDNSKIFYYKEHGNRMIHLYDLPSCLKGSRMTCFNNRMMQLGV